MATFNQCTFIGRLGKDPEFTVTGDVKPITKFSLAVDQGKNQPTMWLNIVTWDKLAETVATYARKGMQVLVQGRLSLRPYKDKNGIDRQAVEIVASIVQLLEKRQGDIPVEPGDEPAPNG